MGVNRMSPARSPCGRAAGAGPPGVGVGGLCRRSGGAGGRQQHVLPHRAAAEPGERRGRHGGGVAAARVRGDARPGCGDRTSLNEALRVFTRESVGGGRRADLLRRSRPGDGRRELPRASGRAA